MEVVTQAVPPELSRTDTTGGQTGGSRPPAADIMCVQAHTLAVRFSRRYAPVGQHAPLSPSHRVVWQPHTHVTCTAFSCMRQNRHTHTALPQRQNGSGHVQDHAALHPPKKTPPNPGHESQAALGCAAGPTCMRAMATVSPNSIWMAVEVTGARSKGHSSRSRGRCTHRSASRSSLQPRTLATLTSLAPLACGEHQIVRYLTLLIEIVHGRSHFAEHWNDARPPCLLRGDHRPQRERRRQGAVTSVAVDM